MSSESIRVCEAALSFATTYWLHSTALLGGVWLWLKLRQTASHSLQERLWKFAATAGLFTAGLQTVTGSGIPLLEAREAPAPAGLSPLPPAARDVDLTEVSADLNLTVEDSLSLVRESLNRLRSVEPVASAEATDMASEATIASAEQETPIFARPTAGVLTLTEPTESPTLLRSASIVLPAHSDSSSPSAREASEKTARWLFLATLLLAVVSTAGLLWYCIEWVLFLHTTRGLRPASWHQLKLLDELRKRLNVKQHVELLTSERFSEPVAFGVRHWKIVLPANLDSRLAETELTSLLAHEIAHLVRGDVAWLHVGRLLTSVFAWQPLNFLARRQWQLQAEFQSDDWAVSRSIDPVSLARCLTVVAEWRSAQRLGAVALSAGGHRSHITDRVERLLAPTDTDIWSSRRRQAVLLLCLTLVGGLLAVNGPSVRYAEGSSDKASLSENGLTTQPTIQLESSHPESKPRYDLAASALPPVTAAPASVENSAGLRSQLADEAAHLAIETALLTDELVELDRLLASHESDSQLGQAIDRLRSRLAILRNLDANQLPSD
ncbi:hypothetical protein GC176_07055 [bacterium]|nr:hypothetical protein [bacterium]